jgi:hypothetical protein
MNVAKNMEAIFLSLAILSLTLVSMSPSDYTNIEVSAPNVSTAAANHGATPAPAQV